MYELYTIHMQEIITFRMIIIFGDQKAHYYNVLYSVQGCQLHMNLAFKNCVPFFNIHMYYTH